MRLCIIFLTILLCGGMAEDCSKSNMEISESQMNDCIQAIAMKASSELYNSADPVSISITLCSTQASIQKDCVKPMMKCFSPEYISWLLEPMKKYLHEIAIAKVGTQYDQECKDYNIQDHKATDEYNQAVGSDYTEKENFEDSDASRQQHEENHEHYYSALEKMDEKRRQSCIQADIYRKLNNCSYYAALKVHYDIKDVTDPKSLKEIGCDALNIISTDCVEGLKKCLSKEDANKYINIHVTQWKTYTIKQIQRRADVKICLDNCHHSNDTCSETDLERKQNRKTQKGTSEYDNTGHDNPTQENEHCSQSKKKNAQDQMENCYKSRANNPYSRIDRLTDPNLLSDTICAIQTSIDNDCAKHLKECFSPGHIEWLVEPMKKYFYNLATKKFGTEYVRNCSETDHGGDYDHSGHKPDHQYSYDYYDTPKSQRIKKNNQNIGLRSVPTSKITQNSHNQVDYNDENRTIRSSDAHRSCSDVKKMEYLEEINNCSYYIALNIHWTLQTVTNPTLISNIICNALASIGTNCVDRSHKCFTPEDIRKSKVKQHRIMRDYLMRLVNKKVNHRSIDNCNNIIDHYSDNSQPRYEPKYLYKNGTEDYAKKYTDDRYETGGPNEDDTGRDYYRYENNKGHGYPDSSNDIYEDNSGYGHQGNNGYGYRYGNERLERSAYKQHNQDMGPYDEHKQGTYKDDFNKMGTNHHPNGGCSNSQCQVTDEHFNNCTHMEHTTASASLKNANTPKEVLTIMSSALTNLNTLCAQHLRKCYSGDHVNWMIEPVKGYLIKLVEGRLKELLDSLCKIDNIK